MLLAAPLTSDITLRVHEARWIRLHLATLLVDVVEVFVDCTFCTGTAWVLEGRHQGEGVGETNSLALPTLVLHVVAEVLVLSKYRVAP